jgi:hypothetical protein
LRLIAFGIEIGFDGKPNAAFGFVRPRRPCGVHGFSEILVGLRAASAPATADLRRCRMRYRFARREEASPIAPSAIGFLRRI